jgi:dienelactone hydrolase
MANGERLRASHRASSRWLRVSTIGVAIALAAGAAGCSSGHQIAARFSITVAPGQVLLDAPLSILVSGAQPGTRVSLSVSSVDSRGVTWSSRSTFLASADGTVDPASGKSSEGSYRELDPMGPIDSMTPQTADPMPYFWSASPQGFTFTATDGPATASATVGRRAYATDVRQATESIATTGFLGQYFAPAGAARHAAVLVFGGSEGGLDGTLLSALLASHGYPSLAIAYFAEPGLPATLSNIPLEYFATALRWLAAQSEVDPSKIFVSGVSRGSEAALLLGAYFPSLVHGVIASVPSDAAICSFPGCGGPAWTLNGQALPYTRDFDDPQPTDNPAAVIPVARIQGPVLLDCGRSDMVWVSCPYAQAIMTELDRAHDRFAHELFAYPDAGHGVGELVPYEPGFQIPENLSGATPLANDVAAAKLWPQVLKFLGSQR